MKAIDTSLLYALFTTSDQWHADARRVMENDRPLLVPPGVLQETLDLIRLRAGTAAAASALAWLAAQPQVVLEPGLASESHQAALDRALATPGSKLSFADVWAVAHAKEHGVPLLSKDKAQLAAFASWE